MHSIAGEYRYGCKVVSQASPLPSAAPIAFSIGTKVGWLARLGVKNHDLGRVIAPSCNVQQKFRVVRSKCANSALKVSLTVIVEYRYLKTTLEGVSGPARAPRWYAWCTGGACRSRDSSTHLWLYRMRSPCLVLGCLGG